MNQSFRPALMADAGKLYFLKDRGRRPAGRLVRKRPEGSKRPASERRKPSAQETAWLGRALLAAAVYLAFYWVGIATGVFPLEGQDERAWLYSFLPADLFVAVVAAIGAVDLLGNGAKREIFVLLGGGGLILLTLERIAYRISSSMHHALTPGERLEVTAMGICLSIGVWVVSHSLRLRAER